MLDQLRLAGNFSGRGTAALVEVAEGHGAILAAIAAGDPDAVERSVPPSILRSRNGVACRIVHVGHSREPAIG